MLLDKIRDYVYCRTTQFFEKRKYGHLGKGSIVYSPLEVDNAKNIYIGDNVNIHEYAWLMGGNQAYSLIIKDGTVVGHFSHIVANHELVIEENVLIADKVFISDCTHNYEDIEVPIIKQGIHNLKSVRIGKDSWIGENVCILGASVGIHCVVASNAVVLNDVPDYSIVAGVPAKVIKQYDFATETWSKIDY